MRGPVNQVRARWQEIVPAFPRQSVLRFHRPGLPISILSSAIHTSFARRKTLLFVWFLFFIFQDMYCLSSLSVILTSCFVLSMYSTIHVALSLLPLHTAVSGSTFPSIFQPDAHTRTPSPFRFDPYILELAITAPACGTTSSSFRPTTF